MQYKVNKPLFCSRIMKRLSFSKSKKLTTNSQFRAVLSRKKRCTDGLLVLYLAENDCKVARLGIAVNKAIGPAVMRNRLKRLIREAFRQNQPDIPAGFDYLVMFSTSWKDKLNKSAAIDEIVNKGKTPYFVQITDSLMALIAKAFSKSR